MKQLSASKLTPKDNEQPLKSKELTGKDFDENILFYRTEFEKKALKNICGQEEKESRIIIPACCVESFLQLMTKSYKKLCKVYPHLNYPMFSDLICHNFALCHKRSPDVFLSAPTVLTYFKMEMMTAALEEFTTE